MASTSNGESWVRVTSAGGMRNLGNPMTHRRPADFLERSVHRAAPQRDQHTLRAVQHPGVSPSRDLLSLS